MTPGPSPAMSCSGGFTFHTASTRVRWICRSSVIVMWLLGAQATAFVACSYTHSAASA